MSPLMIELLVAAGLLALLFGAFVLGGRIGDRLGHDDEQHVGMIQGATLGILGLLAGFCFSGAMSRFVERQEIIVREANAIGTTSLRADLLPEEIRARLRGLLRQYTQQRIELTEAQEREPTRRIKERLEALEREIWTAALAGVKARPETMVVMLPPVNEVFDLLSARHAAAKRHLPGFALALVLVSVGLGAMLLGYGQRGKRATIRLAAMAVVILIGGLIWVTIDLDFPQHGLVRLSAEPLREALAGIPEK